jgi:protein-S-isoprenylcysteine O-methyltransferase Ste14
MSVGPHRLSWALAVAAAGAVLFVAALAAGVWLYVWRLAPSAEYPPMSPAIAAVNGLLFAVFALHHSVMARPWAKRVLTTAVPAGLERALFVWVASLLFLWMCFSWRPTGDVVWALQGFPAWGATALQLAGLALTALGARVVNVFDLSGVRQVLDARDHRHAHDRLTPLADLHRETGVGRPPGPISTRGPYAVVRHPIYLGWVLLVWCPPLMSSGRLLFAAASTAYLVAAIPIEERALLRAHADDYARYRRRVRWRLLPGIY